MKAFSTSRRFSRSLPFLAIFSLVLAILLFGSVATTQELSREEARKEAARLATEAERISGEALKQVNGNQDRKLVSEVLSKAYQAEAERFRKAVELWRAAGDDDRLV